MTRPKTPSFRLDGKRALVTGASSGIGQACAIALGDAGAHVTCLARRADRLNDTVTTIRDAGGQASAYVADQTDLPALKSLLEDQAFDVVLNAAGYARHSPAVETQPEDYDTVMELNVKSAYFLSAWSAAAMIRDKVQGSIIHISSQMAQVGGQDRAVYCASKHALEGFIKAMAIEFGPHRIRINSISPTFILTELTKPTFEDPDKRAWVESKIKLGRAGQVEDIMGAAVYLATEASAMVTGTTVLIDGGWTAD